MARRRPIAGQRGRTRPGTGGEPHPADAAAQFNDTPATLEVPEAPGPPTGRPSADRSRRGDAVLLAALVVALAILASLLVLQAPPPRRAGQGCCHRRGRLLLGGPGQREPRRRPALRRPDHHLHPGRGATGRPQPGPDEAGALRRAVAGQRRRRPSRPPRKAWRGPREMPAKRPDALDGGPVRVHSARAVTKVPSAAPVGPREGRRGAHLRSVCLRGTLAHCAAI